MATFLDRQDPKRAQAEMVAARKTAEARAERERKLKADNVKRRLAILRIEAETKKTRKDVLERDIQTLEQNILEHEREISGGRLSASVQPSSRAFTVEIGIRNASAKAQVAKSRVQRDERFLAEIKTKMKNAERALAESKEMAEALDADIKRLQEEKNKQTGEKKKREFQETSTKLETSRLKTNLRGKKTLYAEAERAYKKALADVQALEAELRVIGR